MSRIGKKLIEIPKDVEIKIEGQDIRIKGPKGELDFKLPEVLVAELTEGKIKLFPRESTKSSDSFWGTARAIVANMIEGVTRGFEKKLEIEGVGFRAEVQGENLILHVGFSHPVVISAPGGINFKVEKNIITISGIDKQKVGEIAAKIRGVRKPEPYKGKGIKYLGEVIRRKAGKKAVTTAG